MGSRVVGFYQACICEVHRWMSRLCEAAGNCGFVHLSCKTTIHTHTHTCSGPPFKHLHKHTYAHGHTHCAHTRHIKACVPSTHIPTLSRPLIGCRNLPSIDLCAHRRLGKERVVRSGAHHHHRNQHDRLQPLRHVWVNSYGCPSSEFCAAALCSTGGDPGTCGDDWAELKPGFVP